MSTIFREVSRKKQMLSPAECAEVLQTVLRGVLAVNGEEGYPYALPINFYYDEAAATIYFHSGKTGQKVECLTRSDKACFTAYTEGERKEGEWWLTIKSVVAFGKVEKVSDRKVIEAVSRKLSLRFTQDEKYIAEEIEKYIDATLLLALKVEHLTGKVVREK